MAQCPFYLIGVTGAWPGEDLLQPASPQGDAVD